MKINELFIRALAGIRDSRLMWEVMGGMYNRRIYAAIAGLYDHAAGGISLPPGAKLLDAGCGRGYAALQLAKKNPEAQVTGIDYSRRQVRAARKFQEKRGIGNCAFEQGNVMNIRGTDAAYDAAVSIGSIKHWPDAVRGISEIRRVLKPGGLLWISETDRDATDEEIRQFMNLFKVWFVPDVLLFWGLKNVIFGQSVTQVSLSSAVREAGFSRIECLRVPAVPYVIVKAIKM